MMWFIYTLFIAHIIIELELSTNSVALPSTRLFCWETRIILENLSYKPYFLYSFQFLFSVYTYWVVVQKLNHSLRPDIYRHRYTHLRMYPLFFISTCFILDLCGNVFVCGRLNFIAFCNFCTEVFQITSWYITIIILLLHTLIKNWYPNLSYGYFQQKFVLAGYKMIQNRLSTHDAYRDDDNDCCVNVCKKIRYR